MFEPGNTVINPDIPAVGTVLHVAEGNPALRGAPATGLFVTVRWLTGRHGGKVMTVDSHSLVDASSLVSGDKPDA